MQNGDQNWYLGAKKNMHKYNIDQAIIAMLKADVTILRRPGNCPAIYSRSVTLDNSDRLRAI